MVYVTKDWPYITCYMTSKWLYNLVCNVCYQGHDYVLGSMLYRFKYIKNLMYVDYYARRADKGH